ncbi:MAG: flagellar motor protein MotA [Rhodospirillales bacterium]|nr:flagellar motor protein MotA [Rhodospirillales bacterium]MDE0710793.1 flagellar motor protein MotA [Rhodospirillales bacterium]
MHSPHRFLIRMVVFVVVSGGLASLLLPTLREAFNANPALNGLIAGVLVIGIAYSFRQVLALVPEIRWLERYASGMSVSIANARPPNLLAPIARTFTEQTKTSRPLISALSMRSLLDQVNFRLDETRDISRYMIGLLIFLGLLGTFWGLLQTVSSFGAVIGNLSISEGGDVASIFGSLKAGLTEPLAGMGTAFSSSLFGLAGSLVLGFLDLQVAQAQNRFYLDLEEWLARRAHVSAGSGSELELGHTPVPVYVQALLEQTAESIDELQKALVRGENERRNVSESMSSIATQIAALGDQLRSDQSSIVRQIERIADTGGNLDEHSLAHLRSMDSNLKRLVEANAAGQEAFLQGVRGEIKLLARTLSTSVPESKPTRVTSKTTRRTSSAAAKPEAKSRSTDQARSKR